MVNQCALNIIVTPLTNDIVCSVNENMFEQMKSLQFDGVSIYMETHYRHIDIPVKSFNCLNSI